MDDEELEQLRRDMLNAAEEIRADLGKMIEVAEGMTFELRHLLKESPEYREGWQEAQRITQEMKDKYR
jgi:hypothetical protein